jgi:NAD(P)-dependent dehydrogenase (short-subunit alcohol dehydrogenase family)
MLMMLPWIEQAGSREAAAQAVAPAIRALFQAGCPLQVRYGALIPCEADLARDLSITIDAATCAAGQEEIFTALQQLAAQSVRPEQINLPAIGCFSLLSFSPRPEKRLDRKICLVTGAAQGFGEGIARELAAAGATLIIADINEPMAESVARSICEQHGTDAAIAMLVDVGQETSVQHLVRQIILRFGGLDLLISNAGVLRAGGLDEMTLEDFEFVTRINYTAFFLVVRYGSQPMKLQARFDPAYTADIVQINSKSGLEGSNRNFAYAGSKFGGIGLVQSFAKELVEHRIKVNAVCPGNFYEGPLWSDPNKGLFVRYLASGKVPGARNTRDVRDFYLAMVPMRRGCRPADIARAILYCVEQQYETGQAVPVTGGQNMLR